MNTIKQFLSDCWYAPTWLKLTNGLWLAILVTVFWTGVSWFVNVIETTTPEPQTLQEGLLGASVMLFPLLFVFVLFGLRFAYEWAATKILLHFGFIEQKKVKSE